MKTPIHPGRVQDNYAQAMCSREVILGRNHTLQHCPMVKNVVKLSVTVRLRVSDKLGGVKTGHALALRGDESSQSDSSSSDGTGDADSELMSSSEPQASCACTTLSLGLPFLLGFLRHKLSLTASSLSFGSSSAKVGGPGRGSKNWKGFSCSFQTPGSYKIGPTVCKGSLSAKGLSNACAVTFDPLGTFLLLKPRFSIPERDRLTVPKGLPDDTNSSPWH